MPGEGRYAKLFERAGFAWVVLAVTLLVTVIVWRYSVDEFQRRSDERFLSRAERAQADLIDRMGDYEQVLKGAAGLFRASDWVTREEWRRYVDSLNLDESMPGIQGIGFSLIIPQSGLASHEAAIRSEGYPDYTVHPVGNRDPYSSIIYLEPFAGRNLRAFGYDMMSEPVRREAMERARDTGEVALSGKVRLVQETNVDVQPGFLVYAPVYRNGMPTGTEADRRAALLGFAYSPFRAHDLMRQVFEDPSRDVEVELFDGAPSPDSLLFRSQENDRRATHTIDLPVVIAGHFWTGRFSSSQHFEDLVDSSLPSVILAFGIAISLLTFALLSAHARHSQLLELQVRARTRELELALDAAEAANRAKTAFLATVSHELRTPLNPIIGFSALMLDDPDNGLRQEERRQLGIIRQCGSQLLDIIDEVLDISSIEAGHVAIDLQPVRLRAILVEQCEALLPSAREAGLQLLPVECDDALVVTADGKRLRQVVRNLVANAIKFTDQGTVSVRARAGQGMARVEVEDTGIGIPAEQQRRLFERFYRISSPRRKLPSGTGLGLAICRRLVEAMHGEIGVQSQDGRGSVFWFRLPLAQQATGGSRAAQSP